MDRHLDWDVDRRRAWVVEDPIYPSGLSFECECECQCGEITESNVCYNYERREIMVEMKAFSH